MYVFTSFGVKMVYRPGPYSPLHRLDQCDKYLQKYPNGLQNLSTKKPPPPFTCPFFSMWYRSMCPTENHKKQLFIIILILFIYFFYLFAENGLLSFENPNYHLDPARLDDALNSNGNSSAIFDELYQELVGSSGRVGEVTGGGGGGGGGGGTRVQARRTYAALDLGSMGVDVTQGPLTEDTANEDAPDNTDNHNLG